MKIGYILTTFPCRSEIFAAREIESLRNSGFDITVLAAERGEESSVFSQGQAVEVRPVFFSVRSLLAIGYFLVRYPLGMVRIIGLIGKLILQNPEEAKRLAANIHTVAFFARVLDKKSIGHIHAYFLNWPGCIGMAVAIATKRTFSIAAHARDIFVEGGAIKLKASKASFIVTCTEYGLDYLKRRLPADCHDKLRLNYHGININHRSTSKEIKNDCQFEKYRLVAAGRLVPKKGFDCLIKAFALVCESMRDCELLIVGDGPESGELKRFVEDNPNLRGHVKFSGWVDHEMTLQLICSSKILVVPSIIAADGDRDGLPNVILEAFACRAAVIASRLPGISEAVIHLQTGLLVVPGDIAGLALAIKQLLSNEKLREELSQKAYEMAAERFNSTGNAEQLAGLFTKVN